MGFRSSFTTQHYSISWPDWFIDKYTDHVWFWQGHLSSKGEWKEYSTYSELAEDIQKAIKWDKVRFKNLVLVWLHECGGITRVQIEKDEIFLSEPFSWDAVTQVTHNYCYGCSDHNKDADCG